MYINLYISQVYINPQSLIQVRYICTNVYNLFTYKIFPSSLGPLFRTVKPKSIPHCRNDFFLNLA
jgi:hypothetical protein